MCPPLEGVFRVSGITLALETTFLRYLKSVNFGECINQCAHRTGIGTGKWQLQE